MATSRLIESVREAPAAALGVRPTTTWREDLNAMILAIWPITALFFDGRNHNNRTGIESFFTTAHIVLYAGMTVFAIYVAILINRYQLKSGAHPSRGSFDFKAIPVGYGVSIIGLCILGVAGPADLTWHSLYGFEINVEAIVSPPHLALFLGGLLVSSTGIRSMWAKRDIAPSMREYLPALLSGILFIAMINFITMYLSAWMTNVAPTKAFVENLKHFPDVMSNQHIGLSEGLRDYSGKLFPYHYYTVGQALGSIVISTIVLLGPTLLILRRWRVPDGTFTITFAAFGLLMNIMTEYRDAWTLIVLVLTGVSIDLMQHWFAPGPRRRLTLGGIRLVGSLAAVVLWFSYFGLLALEHGIGWKTTTWVGACVIGIGSGFGTSFLIAPPAYGPRLVEGGDDIAQVDHV
ncbi:hypothetical protein OM076_07510 [Solirubrobacter ginsenosidimutans]|uniref:Uncharacterized protein n=1 Tax=Solirubrobacter ginsenosidimutans TaxID=490573 RepID=A0A9X3MPM5_9ACTN|nr:hypothetical protein [Solirubrobacter ginsenosidimutans]MDA0160104.1 hypothetical protein [Solirubrobacter ginsenosidimutans]